MHPDSPDSTRLASSAGVSLRESGELGELGGREEVEKGYRVRRAGNRSGTGATRRRSRRATHPAHPTRSRQTLEKLGVGTRLNTRLKRPEPAARTAEARRHGRGHEPTTLRWLTGGSGAELPRRTRRSGPRQKPNRVSWVNGRRRSGCVGGRCRGVRLARRPAGVAASSDRAPEADTPGWAAGRKGARLVDRKAPGDHWRAAVGRSTEA